MNICLNLSSWRKINNEREVLPRAELSGSCKIKFFGLGFKKIKFEYIQVRIDLV